jgi:Tol biopolymer transport system component
MGGRRIINSFLILSSLLLLAANFIFADVPAPVPTAQNSNYTKNILYVFEDSRNLYQVGLMGLTGSDKKILTREGNNWCPVVSPSGEKIAFLSDRSGFNNLWMMNSDGTNQVQLTFNQENINKVDLKCRGQIAWLKATAEHFESIYFLKLGDIWTIDVTGEAPSALTDYHDITSFKISPDIAAPRILFAREKTRNHNGLWTMNIDRTNIRQISDSQLVIPAFDWGDNNTIAFFNNRNISVVQFSGLDKKSIKDTYYLDNEISWSKSNVDKSKNKIAYISDRNNGPNIWVMYPDGSSDFQVTLNGGTSPCWSSDGNSLIFVEGNDIFSTNLNTKEKIRLTYNFSAFFPSVAEIKTNAEPAATAGSK